MMEWIISNIASILVGTMILILFISIIACGIRNGKNQCSGCSGCGCSHNK